MKRTIYQILEIMVILVLALLAPIIVSVTKKNNSSYVNQEISVSAAYISQPESSEISTSINNRNVFIVLTKKYGLYSMGILFIISIGSFLRFKVHKDINGKG